MLHLVLLLLSPFLIATNLPWDRVCRILLIKHQIDSDHFPAVFHFEGGEKKLNVHLKKRKQFEEKLKDIEYATDEKLNQLLDEEVPKLFPNAFKSEQTKKFWALARKHGIRVGATYPVHIPGLSVSHSLRVGALYDVKTKTIQFQPYEQELDLDSAFNHELIHAIHLTILGRGYLLEKLTPRIPFSKPVDENTLLFAFGEKESLRYETEMHMQRKGQARDPVKVFEIVSKKMKDEYGYDLPFIRHLFDVTTEKLLEQKPK